MLEFIGGAVVAVVGGITVLKFFGAFDIAENIPDPEVNDPWWPGKCPEHMNKKK